MVLHLSNIFNKIDKSTCNCNIKYTIIYTIDANYLKYKTTMQKIQTPYLINKLLISRINFQKHYLIKQNLNTNDP